MNRSESSIAIGETAQWYKDAVIYELHVRAFYDSDGDGVGDFPGLTEKLGYLQDLGVTAIWLLPFYPSPLKDDGYDISDYTNVHQSYGTLRDFQVFLREAHRRGLRVITEMVLNHTSEMHQWFQRSRRGAPGSRWRDFYVWRDNSEGFKEARIIFNDFESSNWAWDPVAKAYYFHRFYSHQPDLNYDCAYMRRAIFRVLDFWLGLGVDGMRLDAVPYLYKREGTNCENLPETHAFLRDLRAHVDKRFKDRMLLAEANQWPDQAVKYFGEGDECHMAFHFPLMPRMFMAMQTEDRFPIVDILQETPPIPDSSQWALFLRNHDELTLEMVTDEERDYMYRVYAQDPSAKINLGIRRRLAPLMGNHRRRIELMKALMFSLPGTPVLYYGDEIGMGDNIYLGDRNGVRTPMQWSGDRNAGFSRANPQRLYLPVIIDPEYHYEAINVEAQQNNPLSLMWWMKRLMGLRRRYKAFGRGSLEMLYPDNRKVLAFVRRYGDECILMVANLSRFVQFVELNLSAFKGMNPVELFGRTEFPVIGDAPYMLTLGPHCFYWFSLVPQVVEQPAQVAPSDGQVPVIALSGSWESAFAGMGRTRLEAVLVDFLKNRPWFGGRGRKVQASPIADAIPIGQVDGPRAYIALIRIEYVEGEPETYVVPIAFAVGEDAERIMTQSSQTVIARVELKGKGDAEGGILYDALHDCAFCGMLVDAIGRQRHLKGTVGEIVAWPTHHFRVLRGGNGSHLDASLLEEGRSNTLLKYGEKLVLKVFRRPGAGVNPDLEINLFLSEKVGFPQVPPLAGALEYRRTRQEKQTIAILQGFVPHEGDAWQYTLDALGRYFEGVLSRPTGAKLVPITLPKAHLLDLAEGELPAAAYELLGTYLPSVELLGRRTAEMHIALASDADDPNFAPLPFTELYLHSRYQAIRRATNESFQLLRKRVRDLPEAALGEAHRVLEMEGQVHTRLQVIKEKKIEAMRIRCHGDYHLGQVLYTGKDFVIIDFEGEPGRPLGERRIKRSPLRDVAGMIRSFQYAADVALLGQTPGVGVRPEDALSLEPWARFWQLWVSAAYLKSYLSVIPPWLLPPSREDLRILLDIYLMVKAIYELDYELKHRPGWVRFVLRGMLQLLEPVE